jgi:hypothetical protein
MYETGKIKRPAGAVIDPNNRIFASKKLATIKHTTNIIPIIMKGTETIFFIFLVF